MHPLHPSDPREVGGMTLMGRLGVGGMGVVYLASQDDGELVALKVIRPELTADPEFRARFTQEVRHALRVRGPFLAEAREASSSQTPQFIAWVYVPGEDLGITVRRHGPLEGREVAALAAALADSLGRLHGAGVVHRDVKPSNIQLGPRGPILLDLGVSTSADSSSLTTTAMSIGTPAWMSPEQWRGARHGPTGDIWGWGAVVAFAAGGLHPFGTGTGEALAYRILHEGPTLPSLDGPLGGLVASALATDSESRPTSEEILTALATDSASVTAYVAARWDRLARLAVVPTTNDTAATVRIGGASRTELALAPTRLDRDNSHASSRTPLVRRTALVAGLGGLMLAGVATAFVLGDAASTPIAPPAPTHASTGTASAPPVTPRPTIASPSAPAKVHAKPAKKPGKAHHGKP